MSLPSTRCIPDDVWRFDAVQRQSNREPTEEVALPPRSDRAPTLEEGQREKMGRRASELCAALGLSDVVVRDLVLALYGRRTSELTLAEQDRLFGWLLRPKGRAKYQRTAEVREALLEVAGKGYLTPRQRKAAALEAGLTDSDGGVLTESSRMTAPELVRLLEAHLSLTRQEAR